MYRRYKTRYETCFAFVDTEEQAKQKCEVLHRQQNAYVNRRYKAHYTSWESNDHKEHKFIVWYVR